MARLGASCLASVSYTHLDVYKRQIHGHVIDFIQWHWRGHYWPAFNLADAAIVGGAIGIALFGLFDGKNKKKAG